MNALQQRFQEGWTGIQWALRDLGVDCDDMNNFSLGSKQLVFIELKDQSLDAYEIRFHKDSIKISSSTTISTIVALQELKNKIEAHDHSSEKKTLKFKTRFFKHEIRFKRPGNAVDAKGLPDITAYSDDFNHSFIQFLVKRGFNSLVLYCGYHPFENFLDYKGFEHGISSSAQLRKANFVALSGLLQCAKAYGLQTFLHHYVSHYTQALSDHLKLGFKEGKMLLAGLDHPEVDAYNRYIYKRSFETLPSLDGLFLNFESAGNAIPFVKRTLFQVANSMKNKPKIFLRLWGLSDVDGVKDLLKDYKGEKGLIHKGHDTNDTVYYPVADDRIKIWKDALPDVEFTYSIGPCHNCSTNICNKLWTDPQYVSDLLKSMQLKGADSISFQAYRDVSLDYLKDKDIYPSESLKFSQMNQGHLDAVLDYVHARTISPQEWTQRYAQYFNIERKQAGLLKEAIFESSQIILKQFQQFCYGSPQEGYSFPGRFTYYQEPFFYYPMSFLNRIGEVKVNYSWRPWAVRDTKIKVVPNDTQAVIDYVDPRVKKKTARNPDVITQELKAHIKKSAAALTRLQKLGNSEKLRFVCNQISLNINFGQRIWREIQIAKYLYTCYFAIDKRSFFASLRKAHSMLLDSIKNVDMESTKDFHSTTERSPYFPEQDAKALSDILLFEKEPIQYKALQAYLLSHVHYNEIRRLNRSYVSMREEMKARNRKLLEKSLHKVNEAVSLLQQDADRLYLDNVCSWKEYIEYELSALTPPAMTCEKITEADAETGFRDLFHDQNYRWGEYCWEDFSSFFRRLDFFREDRMDCKVNHSKEGLVVHLREHGIDWKSRKETWDKNRGTANQTGFMQVFIECGTSGKEFKSFTVFFEGSGATRAEVKELDNGHRTGSKPSIYNIHNCDFQHTDSSWHFQIVIPWGDLAKQPKAGTQWRFNVLSNPAVIKNRRVIWCQGYEFQNDVARLGTIVFN